MQCTPTFSAFFLSSSSIQECAEYTCLHRERTHSRSAPPLKGDQWDPFVLRHIPSCVRIMFRFFLSFSLLHLQNYRLKSWAFLKSTHCSFFDRLVNIECSVDRMGALPHYKKDFWSLLEKFELIFSIQFIYKTPVHYQGYISRMGLSVSAVLWNLQYVILIHKIIQIMILLCTDVFFK